MSQYILYFCNDHKYHVTNIKHKRTNIKCTVNKNRKKKCITHAIAQNKSKDDLSAIAKNLNANNPYIVLENINSIVNDNIISQKNICHTNMSCINKDINTDNFSNAIEFNNNKIFLDNGYSHNATISNANNKKDINDSTKHVDSVNAMISSKNCGVKAVNFNVTVSCDNSNNYNETVDINNSKNVYNSDDILFSCNNDKDHISIVNSTLGVNNSTIGVNNSNNTNFDNNVINSHECNCNSYKAIDDDIGTNNSMNINFDNNVSDSCDNDKCHNIVEHSAINANNSTNTDFDNNMMNSCDNEHAHERINGESYVNNPTKHVDCDNAMIFSKDCNNEHNRVKIVDHKTVNLNVTFSYDNGNSQKMIYGDINVSNSLNDDNIPLSCDNDRDHSIVHSANNSTNDTDFDNNVTFSCDNNNCNIIDNDSTTNNFMNNNNSCNNVTFTYDNDNINNSETGVILNDVMIFPFDNNSSILNDLTSAKTSMNHTHSDSDNHITFSCDDNTIDNIVCANTTNISEYLPSETTTERESTEHNVSNNISTTNKNNISASDKNSSASLIDISSINTFGCREDNLFVPFSKPKGLQKKNFCYYCKKFQSKIARHLENVHKSEPEVKKFVLLPKGNLERKKIIETIRRKGNFIHNTDPSINTGELIVCRRPTRNSCKTVQNFTCCAKCKGWFTKNNIRHHFKKCIDVGTSNGRNVQVLGRTVMGRIHECASETVRKVLFPILREDDVTRCIRYDKLLITYANKLCIKYNHQHQQDMIRARLRLLGRFLIAVKEYRSNVTEFTDIYNPSMYDDCLKAVNKISHFDAVNKKYGAPSVASNIGTYIKQIGNLLISECIKINDVEKQNTTENFLKLVQEDYGISINKTVEENVTQHKRQKKVILPSTEDIKKLHLYLKSERKVLYTKLQKKFMYKTWLELAKVTLTSTQVFNRRRAGEIERVTIEDFNTREGITKETYLDLYKSLGTNLQQVANKYVRFLIRGKLGRTVPVILDMELVQCIELILKHRKDANVPEKNPYVFGIPSNTKRYFKYLRACVLMRYFSKKCDAQIPHSLRGTELRKHIATTCITLNLSENEVDDLANFMGHHEKIHKRHYRQSIPALEIIRMTKFLEAALGENVQQQSNNSDSEEEGTRTDTSNEASDSDAETCMINSREPLSVQSGKNKFSKICITNKQQKSIKRKIKHQNHAITCNDNDENYSPNIKKRRSTSPYGLTKRRRWTEEERTAVIKEFSEEINSSQLPSNKKISYVKEKNKYLINRSVAQIKTWLHNYISGKIKRY